MSQSGRGRGGRVARNKIPTLMTQDHRLELASMVRDNKQVLIGKFSPSVTQKSRDQKWTEIYTHLTELGAVFEDVNMLRFTAYPNLAKATKKKRDLAKSTGQGPPNYTELDNIILDIIGRDSAAATGIAGATEDDDVNFGGETEERERETSILDETTESLFGSTITSVMPGTSRGGSFTVPRSVFAIRPRPILPPAPTPRTNTSSPINEEMDVTVETAAANNTQQTSSNAKKRPRGPLTSLLVDDRYKELKVEKLQLEMDLIRIQIEAEKRRCEAEQQRAEFFRLAGLTFNGKHTLVIASEEQSSVHHLQL
jgi:hypothetical protein